MKPRHQAVDDMLLGLGTGSRGGGPATAELHALYVRRLGELGAAVLPALRAVLDGPPLPIYPASRAPGAPCYGGKLVALEALAAAGDPADASRFERLGLDQAEPAAVRLAAWAAWLNARGEPIVPDLVAMLLESLDPETTPHLDLGVLAAWHGSICRVLCGYLYHRDKLLRLRARDLLVAIGGEAITPLAVIVASAEDEFAQSEAAAALERLAPEALAAAREQRAASARKVLPTEPIRPRTHRREGPD